MVTLTRADSQPACSRLATRGSDCAFYEWSPPEGQQPRGVALILHGLGAHARFPTVRFAAELLSRSGLAVCAMDLPGHGESPGLRGYIGSADGMVADARAATAEARRRHPALPLILVGSSLGGCLALLVSLVEEVDSIVLLCPMIALSVSRPLRTILWLLTYSPLARLALIPSSASSNEKQYADPARRLECARDPLSYGGLLRPASAYSCVDAASRLRGRLGKITTPFLLLTAGGDVVVNNDGAEELLQHAATPAGLKHSRCFPRALHGLLCEPPERRAEVEGVILEYVSRRVGSEVGV